MRYRPNDLDDQGRRFIALTAYAVNGLATDQYVGGASIIDDDPTPGLTVRTGAPRIIAGHAATWRLTLDKPVNYFAYAVARPVKAVSGPQLRVGDLAERFRERYFGKGVALATPLYRTHTLFFVEIPQHRTTGIMTIPTRRQHGVTRAISLRFRAPHLVVTHPLRTVKVVPAH